MVVDARGFLKVMDFGFARLAEAPHHRAERLTEVGAVVGTVDYMAPEQLTGEEIDHRVDVYATGAVLFECVVGRPVFDAPSVMTVMAKHLEEEPEDPRGLNPEVPEGLSHLILKALEKNRENRWASAREMRQGLEAIGASTASAAP
jgi:serine/threonine-protein kinase